MNAHHDTNILIIGAGPTGLVLALWLARRGVRVRIVDKTAEPGTTSRALAVQARTLEFYRQLGIADAVVERGRRALAVNLWVTGRKAARAVFGAMGDGISPFPYALIFPQDEHERLLIERLAETGVKVERSTELLDFEDAGTHVSARLKCPDGSVEACTAAFIAGCDGAHSRVREGLGISFPGGTYALFPMKGEGHARLVGTIREDAEHQADKLTWDDVGQRVIAWMDIKVARVNWFSTYRVHHRVADHFRKGRAFLLGDAAHIHSPVGGQGMNTGIGDAVNLGWKLAAVLQGRADSAILDSYEPERIAFARRLVATTDEAFTGVISPGPLARFFRLRIVPLVLPALFKFRAARRFMFRTVSQTVVNYRGSSLSEGRAGAIHGGDRLPWVKTDVNTDNFTPLTSLDWQVHVYGDASSEIRALCDARKLPLHTFAWRPEMTDQGLSRNAVYLVRPDGYVALASAEAAAGALKSYLDARKLFPASS